MCIGGRVSCWMASWRPGSEGEEEGMASQDHDGCGGGSAADCWWSGEEL